MMDDEKHVEQNPQEATTDNSANGSAQTGTPFRSLTRVERRNLWLKE